MIAHRVTNSIAGARTGLRRNSVLLRPPAHCRRPRPVSGALIGADDLAMAHQADTHEYGDVHHEQSVGRPAESQVGKASAVMTSTTN